MTTLNPDRIEDVLLENPRVGALVRLESAFKSVPSDGKLVDDQAKSASRIDFFAIPKTDHLDGRMLGDVLDSAQSDLQRQLGLDGTLIYRANSEGVTCYFSAAGLAAFRLNLACLEFRESTMPNEVFVRPFPYLTMLDRILKSHCDKYSFEEIQPLMIYDFSIIERPVVDDLQRVFTTNPNVYLSNRCREPQRHGVVMHYSLEVVKPMSGLGLRV